MRDPCTTESYHRCICTNLFPLRIPSSPRNSTPFTRPFFIHRIRPYNLRRRCRILLLIDDWYQTLTRDRIASHVSQQWNTCINICILFAGEAEEWATDADAMTTDETALPHATAPPSNPQAEKINDSNATEDTNKPRTTTKPEDVPCPKIRLKLNLATDPALPVLSASNIKLESGSSPTATTEFLTSLPQALQTALASRGFFYNSSLNLPEPNTRPEAADSSRQQLFICLPCGIRFSSLSTLEAHQTYYCTHRANKPQTDTEDAKSVSGNELGNNQSDQDVAESATKAPRTGKQYTCTHCSYSADKKVSLNRHMRMHTVSPSPVNITQTASNGESTSDNQDRYCAECDIRFSSQKTYRAHKTHYCSSRHMVKPAVNSTTALPTSSKTASSCTSGSTPASPVDTTSCRSPPSPTVLPSAQQPFLALPTNPIIIVPYSLVRSASVLPALLPGSNIPNPDTPCFLMPNGTLQPMTQALCAASATIQPEISKPNNKSKEIIQKDAAAPLDLSIKKSVDTRDCLIDSGENENENKLSVTSERSDGASSLRASPPSTPVSQPGVSPSLSISPKRKHETETSRSSSPRLSRLTPKSNMDTERSQTSPETNALSGAFGIPPALHPLLLRAGSLSLLPPDLQLRLASGDIPALPTATAPQVLVKQGVSKCKECNIVFCKHENYVIHKKHYCSARSQEDDSSKTSGSPPISPGGLGTTSPAGQYQQLICLACGIKFTSLDNLNAHQAYYCLKRNEHEVRRCGKCRGIAEPGHQCISSGTLAGWKCPCCDVVSATASAAQRHMESHTGVKAYRCTICRYKGNTLRGMRTHIRMHFDKRSPDLQVPYFFIL